jgi:hypothetical protein
MLLLHIVAPLMLGIKAVCSAVALVALLLHLREEVELHFAVPVAVGILALDEAKSTRPPRELAVPEQVFLQWREIRDREREGGD